jgi:hypothetical protein
MYDVLNKYLPEPYMIHHPFLTTTNLHIEEKDGALTKYSMNWCQGDDTPEITDGYSGKTIDGQVFYVDNKIFI